MIGPLVVAVIAIALTAAALLCANGIIGRNQSVGIRIPSFYASDDAWRRGHRAAVVPMAIAACICVGLIFVAAAVPSYSGATAVIVSLVVLVGGVIVGAIVGSQALRRTSQ